MGRFKRFIFGRMGGKFSAEQLDASLTHIGSGFADQAVRGSAGAD
jgi:hypothetical protein